MIEFYEFNGAEYTLVGSLEDGEVSTDELDFVTDFVEATDELDFDDEEAIMDRVSNEYFMGVIPDGGQAQAAAPAPDTSSGDGSSHDYGPDVEDYGPEVQALQRAEPADLDDTADVLLRAHKHMVWPDLADQRASDPFWDDDESMPEMVKQAVREALRSGAITEVSTHLPAGTTRADVRRFFSEKLDQPAGWSLRSLTEDYASRFGVPEEKAAVAVRRQTKSALDTAREIAYEAQGDTDDRLFKHINPDDERTTDASYEMLERTNPDYGGTPRPLDELADIYADVRRKHFPKLRGAKWADGWQDRGTYVEHFPS